MSDLTEIGYGNGTDALVLVTPEEAAQLADADAIQVDPESGEVDMPLLTAELDVIRNP